MILQLLYNRIIMTFWGDKYVYIDRKILYCIALLDIIFPYIFF